MKYKLELTKNYRINVLLDFYGALLTSKQKDYIQQYYGEDYSLGEIADNFNISRQAVYDNIKRTENTLEIYEDKMHLYQKFLLKNKKFDKIYNYLHKHYPKDPYLNKFIVELEKLED